MAEEKLLVIQDDIEAEHVESTDHFFHRIGIPIPISNDPSSVFRLETPPSWPLAIALTHRLIFVAHSSGFYVASTKDVMDAAKDKPTSSSIQQLCLLDVPLPNIRILSVSSDSSTLSVSAAHSIHFFSIPFLINKDVKPAFSDSLPGAATVKDFKWTKASQTSYLVLSRDRNLYHASLHSPLKHVFNDVDAVDWSVKGKFIAVARGGNLIILSSKFKEKLHVSLPFKSWICDSDDKYTVRVDSISWVRNDSIVVGCLQQTADDKEENYLLQVVKSTNGKITDASCKPVVLSFYDLFPGIIDEIVPSGTGPYLFLSYLEQCGLALAANRKNTDQHVVLLGWSINDDTSDVAAIDIERDSWLPRIELQDNGDDNLIMGLCVDKVSLYEKVKVEVGVEEQKELSPYCVLICVTLEGKLVMFHVASVTESTSAIDSALVDEEEGILEEVLEEVNEVHDESTFSSRSVQQTPQEPFLGFQLQDVSKKENDLSSNKNNENITTAIEKPVFSKEIVKNHEFKSHVDSMSTMVEQQHKALPKTLNTESTSAIDSALVDEEEGILEEVNEVHDESTFSSRSVQQTPQEPFLGFQLQDVSKKENDLSSNKNNENITTAIEKPVFSKEIVKNHEFKSHVDSMSTMVEQQHKALPKTLNTDIIGQKQQPSRQENDTLGHLNFKIANSEGPMTTGVASKLEVKKREIAGSGPSLLGNIPSAPRQLYHQDFLKGAEPARETAVNTAITPNWGQRVSIDSSRSGSTFPLKDSDTKSSPVNISVAAVPTEEQKTSIFSGTIESLPSTRSSQLPSQETFAFGKPSNLKPFVSMDEHEAPSVSRQLGNIKQMVKELDLLLDSIEGAGGFKDACTGFQRTSVESLEEKMKALSGKTRMWKGVLDDRIGTIQNLLDKTVQVLARKIYIDGIIKQASDNQYWELWNRQKLSSELELKRSHISELNQGLTNRLIEMERHFNALELNNFGEIGRSHVVQRAPQGRYRSSRNTRSLYSLHNAVSSQLEAAEKLSECLSQQMAALSVASPVKQKNVKKELFETIGIPYDDSFSSPDATKVSDNLLLKKLQLSNGSAATKDQSRRRQSSSSKNSDAETARRRRDSLDQSLVSFEPTRTTVKRMLLRESQKTSVTASSPLINRQHFDARIPDRSAVTHQGEKMTPSTFLYSSSSKANERSMTSQNSVRDAYNTSAEKSRNLEKFDSSFNNGMKPFQQTEVSPNRTSPASMALPKQTQFTPSKLVEMPNPSTRENWLTSSASGKLKDEKTTNDLISKYVSEKPGSSSSSMASIVGGKTCQFAIADGKGQAGQTASSSSAFSITGVPSSTISSPLNLKNSFFGSTSSSSLLSPTVPFDSALTTSKATIDAIPVVSSSPSLSISSLPVSNSSSSLQTSGTVLGSVNQPSVSESSKTQVQPLMAKVISPGNVIASQLKPEVQPPFAKPAASPSATGSSQTGLQSHEVQQPSAKPAASPSTTGPSQTGVQPHEVQPPSAKPAASPSVTGPFQTGLQPHAGGAPSSLTSTSPEMKTEPPKIGVPPAADKVDKTDTPLVKSPEFSLNLESSASSITAGTGLASVSQSSLSNLKSPSSSIALNIQPQQSSSAGIQFGSAPSTSDISSSVKNDNLDVVDAEEDEMEEEAPETSQVNELSLGSLGGFGFGSTPSSTAPKGNPFGGPFGNAGTTQVSSPFTMSIPNGELFKPASFSLQSSQPPQPSTQSQIGAFSGGFGTGIAAQPPTQTGFGQPSQIGQQALGSVLGAFGQSRQIGTGPPGIASPSGFGTGFSSTSSIGGFSSAATGGGFANLARSGAGFSGMASGSGGFGAMASVGSGFAGAASGGGGGFAGAASGAGGFAAAASGGSGFAGAASGGGGFAGAASGGGFATGGNGLGGGFGGFGSQQGAGGFAAFGINSGIGQQPNAGFSSFGSNTGGTGKPAELFTQMRK